MRQRKAHPRIVKGFSTQVIPSLLHRDPQLPQLPLAHRRRRIHHQIHRPRRLGERNHFPQTLRSGQNHHNAVEAQRDASMRRRAILQRFQKKSKTRPRFFFGHAQRAEDSALHILAVNTNRSRPQLRAIQHHVIGQRPHRAQRRQRIVQRLHARLQLRHILFMRRGKRMMRRHPASSRPHPTRTWESSSPTENENLSPHRRSS